MPNREAASPCSIASTLSATARMFWRLLVSASNRKSNLSCRVLAGNGDADLSTTQRDGSMNSATTTIPAVPHAPVGQSDQAMRIAAAVRPLKTENRPYRTVSAGQSGADFREQVLQLPGRTRAGEEPDGITVRSTRPAGENVGEVRSNIRVGNPAVECIPAWATGIEDRGNCHVGCQCGRGRKSMAGPVRACQRLR